MPSSIKSSQLPTKQIIVSGSVLALTSSTQYSHASNVASLVTLYIKITAWENLKKLRVTLLKFSQPAVSQIYNFTFEVLLTSSIFVLYSSPIVTQYVSLNLSSIKRTTKLDLPTPESPIIISLNLCLSTIQNMATKDIILLMESKYNLQKWRGAYWARDSGHGVLQNVK